MASFSKMYEQYVEQVYCFLRELSGDDGFAEELTWKTFYRAFLHIDSFENRSSVFEWLCEIGENVYLREMKRQKKTEPGKRQIPVFKEEVSGSKRQIPVLEEEVSESKRQIPVFKEEVSGSKRQIPVFEGEESGGEVNAAERKKWIRRGLRRIRFRWVCSVMAASLILFMLVGVMLLVGGSLKGGLIGK